MFLFIIFASKGGVNLRLLNFCLIFGGKPGILNYKGVPNYQTKIRISSNEKHTNLSYHGIDNTVKKLYCKWSTSTCIKTSYSSNSYVGVLIQWVCHFHPGLAMLEPTRVAHLPGNVRLGRKRLTVTILLLHRLNCRRKKFYGRRQRGLYCKTFTVVIKF